MRSAMTRNTLYGFALALALFILLSPAASRAGVGRVICVPWQGDPGKFHTAVSGVEVRLKGVIETTDTGPVWYRWVFGDGTQSPVASLNGGLRYNVEALHIYSGAVGTPFTAQLQVDGVDSSMANAVSDPYLVKIEQDNLDARVNMAIDEGLWWLFNNNYTHSYLHTFDGSEFMVWRQWDYISDAFASPTASAIQAFAINNHKINGDPEEDPYVRAVRLGMNWLLQGYRYDGRWPMLQAVAISAQAQGNPDANGNGYGVEVRDYENRPVYQGGQIIDAIIASGVLPGDDTGRDFTGRGSNWTFGELMQDLCDTYAWGQVDSGTYRGGWRYSWNHESDNSAAQWAAIGLIPAQEPPWNCVVPGWVKTENAIWLGYSYNAGHFGYLNSGSQHDWYFNTTPSGMVQMAMDGQVGYDDPATPDDERDPKWAAAEAYMADNWNGFLHNKSYNWGEDLTYGWYAFAKAMRLAVPHPVVRVTKSDGTTFDWYLGSGDIKGMARRIIEIQQPSGAWDGSLTNAPLTTAWMIIVLRPALFAAAPVACFTAEPNPTFPDRDVAFDPSCSTHSETDKDIDNLVLFQWDWDNDGTYDESTDE
ncbi:MAG: hypothetical protein DRH20_16630, partial [Deltaproteobacteria bacterium]